MKKNFLLVDSVYLVFNEAYYDLHNTFFLAEVHIDISANELELVFHKYDEDWVQKDVADRITMRFEVITFLQVGGECALSSGAIEELGYKNPSDFDDGWLLRENQSSAESHLFLRLSNNDFIRIGAERALFSFDMI